MTERTKDLPNFKASWIDEYPETWIMVCKKCGHTGIWAKEENPYGCSGCGMDHEE